MGVFDGIEHVAAEGTSSSRQYFEAGNYQVTINSVFLYERRLGGGKLFIVETTVNESDNPNIKPGELRNWVQSFALPSALPRIKAFIGTALGFSSQMINTQITAELCNRVVNQENPLQGKRLTLNCSAKTTKNGKPFTSHIWGAI
jgi:hypothetical protein